MPVPRRITSDERARRLAAHTGETGILFGTSAAFSPQGQRSAAEHFATNPHLPHPRWNLEPAQFVPNQPTGVLDAPWVSLDHVSMVDARPLNGTPGQYTMLGPRDPQAAHADWPVTDPLATAQPAIGTAVRMPVVIAKRLNGSGVDSPTPAPGVFNDELALLAVNAALSGAPNSAVRRRVSGIANRYDDLEARQLMIYLADDAIARQLIARAGDVPLSSANRSVLEAAQRYLGNLPASMPSPFGLSAVG